MPIISSGGGGGGAPFNGGTITTPLVIEDATANSIALRVQSANPPGDGQLTFQVEDNTGSPVFTVDSDGQTRVETQDAFGDFRVRIAGQQRILATGGQAQLTFGALALALSAAGWIVSGVNAAPADGDMSPGDFALWLDQTNGSPALNLKGAQADGTVFSGLVPRLSQVSPKGTITSGALSTVQLVTATGAQILTTRDAETITPCTFNPGAATTATVTVALSPDNVTYSTLGVETEPAGVAFDGTIHLVKVRVPAGWYLKLTVNAQAVLGLTTYY